MAKEEIIIQKDEQICDACEEPMSRGARAILDDDLVYHQKCYKKLEKELAKQTEDGLIDDDIFDEEDKEEEEEDDF